VGTGDYCYDVKTDSDNNVLVTGSISGATTLKYDPDGTLLWDETYGAGAGQVLAVTSDDQIVVAGTTGNDYLTLKYDEDGDLLWDRTYNGPGNSTDKINDVTIDNSGNVIVTGTSIGSGTNQDFATVKYDADGDLQWVARYNGVENGREEAFSVGTDNAGDVYVSGYWRYETGSPDYDYIFDYIVAKYDADDGHEIWSVREDRLEICCPSNAPMGVDGSGNVYAARWYQDPATSYDILTVKYDADGNRKWAVQYNGPGITSDLPFAMTLDYGGRPIVTSQSSTNWVDFATVKYDVYGNQIWEVRTDFRSGGADSPRDIDVDSSGNVYVGGGSQQSDTDYAFVKYEADDYTAIELLSFEAEADDGAVLLTWETAIEPDNVGFALWRSDSAEGAYSRITPSLIPAEGDATHGASYEYIDEEVDRGETYWYKLEDVDIYGQSAFHGPVNAMVPEAVLCGMVSHSGGASLVLFALVMTAVIAVRRTIERKKRPYRKPEVRTVSGDEVLKRLGPAQTCSPTPAQCPTSD